LRHLVRIADGITARVFGVLNELAIDAVATGAECISDTVIETWKPAIEKEALSPDSAAKLALKLRLNDAPVSISVPPFTQIGPSLRFECKSTMGPWLDRLEALLEGRTRGSRRVSD
jgi:hypothetical protein